MYLLLLQSSLIYLQTLMKYFSSSNEIFSLFTSHWTSCSCHTTRSGPWLLLPEGGGVGAGGGAATAGHQGHCSVSRWDGGGSGNFSGGCQILVIFFSLWSILQGGKLCNLLAVLWLWLWYSWIFCKCLQIYWLIAYYLFLWNIRLWILFSFINYFTWIT